MLKKIIFYLLALSSAPLKAMEPEFKQKSIESEYANNYLKYLPKDLYVPLLCFYDSIDNDFYNLVNYSKKSSSFKELSIFFGIIESILFTSWMDYLYVQSLKFKPNQKLLDLIGPQNEIERLYILLSKILKSTELQELITAKEIHYALFCSFSINNQYSLRWLKDKILCHHTPKKQARFWLIEFVMKKNIPFIKLLFDVGIDADFFIDEYHDIFSCFSQCHYFLNRIISYDLDLAIILIKLGKARIDKIESETGKSLLHILIGLPITENIKLKFIQNILNLGLVFPLNVIDKNGQTPFSLALTYNHFYLAKMLLELKSNMLIENEKKYCMDLISDLLLRCQNESDKLEILDEINIIVNDIT